MSEARTDSLRIPVVGSVRVGALHERGERLSQGTEAGGSGDGGVRAGAALLTAEESRDGGEGSGGADGARTRRGESADHLVFEGGEETLLLFHFQERLGKRREREKEVHRMNVRSENGFAKVSEWAYGFPGEWYLLLFGKPERL